MRDELSLEDKYSAVNSINRAINCVIHDYTANNDLLDSKFCRFTLRIREIFDIPLSQPDDDLGDDQKILLAKDLFLCMIETDKSGALEQEVGIKLNGKIRGMETKIEFNVKKWKDFSLEEDGDENADCLTQLVINAGWKYHLQKRFKHKLPRIVVTPQPNKDEIIKQLQEAIEMEEQCKKSWQEEFAKKENQVKALKVSLASYCENFIIKFICIICV